FREAAKDEAQAIDIYRALVRFFPEDADYRLRLASALAASGKAEEAILALDELRRTLQEARNDPRVDLAEADAAEILHDFDRACQAAKRAHAAAEKLGAKLTVARAFLLEAWAARGNGRLAEAGEAAEGAKRAFDAVGDAWGRGQAMTVAATVRADAGDLDGA